MEQLSKPDALTDVGQERILDLDVRSDLRAGNDPFERIMHARQALAHDGVLRLRATFQPKPLYTVMAREGFDAWTEQLAEDDWRVWFYRAEDSAEEKGAEAAGAGTPLPTCGTPRPEPTDMHVLDVRGLEPPEPMTRTLEAVEALAPGDTVVQINSRVPRFLLPELETRGFQHTVRQDEDDVVRVFIRRTEEHPVLDVRILPPKEKHPTIFETFDGLQPGEAFVIVNDHDPVPLKYQFQAERPDAFSWEYQAEGPQIWRVKIGRVG